MEIIILGRGSDPVGKLDPAVRRFVESAWGPPATQQNIAGLRRRNATFPDKAAIMQAAAEAMDSAFASDRDEQIAYDMNPSVDRFATWTFREDPTLRAYRLLMKAWNERRDLGTCQGCTSLMLPGKGKVAKYCSDVCRMFLNRQDMKARERIIRSMEGE